MRYFPLVDLKNYQSGFLSRDVLASVAVILVCVPQGVAYAMIAGLPPAMGLYAAAVPAIVGSLFRSSRHVITGPTNAVSILVGTGVAAEFAGSGADPIHIGITLALIVGVVQLLAGVLRLNVLVDYISNPVLRGYITGAAILIAAGQLANVTATEGTTSVLGKMIWVWVSDLRNASPTAFAFALGTIVIVVGLRRIDSRLPGPILAMAGSIGLAQLLDLPAQGLRVAGDIARTPLGFPPLTLPSLDLVYVLLPLAGACTVLSLVESTSSARAIATKTGQRLDISAEFTGQGLANLAAAFFGGYPVSGSLTRSALNVRAGAHTRLAGAFSGLMMLLVLLVLGPLVDETPIASLAGLLLVVAADLIDWRNIRETVRGTISDRTAFVVTVLGTWALPLDQAIYLGVGISLVLFLRHARLLTVREMTIGEKGRFREVEPEPDDSGRQCSAIRILNLTGPLFFAVAGELRSNLNRIIDEREIRVLILRIRQAQDVDATTASVLETVGSSLQRAGKTLLLIGMRPAAMQLLDDTGIAERLGRENLFSAQSGWFTAMESALRRALELAGEHSCGSTCPFAEYLTAQDALRSAARKPIGS